MSGGGILGELGKRLLQAVEQRITPDEGAAREAEAAPAGIAPDRLDAALARLRAERPVVDPQAPPGDAPKASEMSD